MYVCNTKYVIIYIGMCRWTGFGFRDLAKLRRRRQERSNKGVSQVYTFL